MTGSIKLGGISIMAKFREQRRNRPRSDRRFRPGIAEANAGGVPLDQRLLLSGVGKLDLHPEQSRARVEDSAKRAPHHAKAGPAHYQRLTPTEKINAEYNAFLTAFNQQLDFYVASLNETSTGSTTVSATVTTAYAAGSPIIEVSDASVFGPAGPFSTPVLASATIGSAPPIGSFTLTGSSGNSLTINVADSSFIPLTVGTVLTATVPVSASTSAASIFPSYITNSTIQMATSLVVYFNNLPLKLPQQNGPPHTPTQHGAIQKYVYASIAGNGTLYVSLQKSLLAIPLPTTPGSDLSIYMAAVASAVAQSRQQVLGGIEQIYAGTLLISANAPANRLGETFNSSTTGSSATSTSGGTSSSSTATA
jgi:hypothetical protein